MAALTLVHKADRSSSWDDDVPMAPARDAVAVISSRADATADGEEDPAHLPPDPLPPRGGEEEAGYRSDRLRRTARGRSVVVVAVVVVARRHRRSFSPPPRRSLVVAAFLAPATVDAAVAN